MLKIIHRLARIAGSSSRDVRGFSGVVAAIFFAWGGAERTQALTYVDHLSMPEHYTMLSTNISLYDDPFRDAEGNLLAFEPNALAMANIFSTKALYGLTYDSTRMDIMTLGHFGADISLGTGSEVSYYAKTYVHVGPNVSDNWVEQTSQMTGSRNALYNYNLVSRAREGVITLSSESPESPYRPGNALLAGGDKTFLTSNGGIHYLSINDLAVGSGVLHEFVTAQGSGAGELNNPSALNVGPDGKLYVLDAGNNRIQKFDIETGLYSGGFNLPDGMEVYSEIMVMEDWLPDPSNPARVERRVALDAEGKPTYLNNGGNVFATSMAISHEGHIYLGDGLGGGFVFDLEGNLLSTFHPPEDTSWDGTLNLDIAGNLPVGAGSFLMYDGYGNVFTYVEGKGINRYRDEAYPTLPYLYLVAEGTATTDAASGIWGGVDFKPSTELTVTDTLQLHNAHLYVEGVGDSSPTTASLNGGSIVTDTDVIVDGAGRLIINSHNTYTTRTYVTRGGLTINGSLAGDVVVQNDSNLSGNGLIGGSVELRNSSVLLPGDGIGLLTIEGGLTMEEMTWLQIQLGGLAPELSDQLTVEGIFTVNGRLDLNLVNDYVPEIGDSFWIFTNGFDAGAFDEISTNLGEGKYWDTSRLASEGVIKVVPEPSTWALLGLGAGIFLWRRHRVTIKRI